MITTCPICGATWNNNVTCQEMFDEFLALEFSYPAYGKVHMLTVACFMIQHQRYSDIALIWMKEKLNEVLNHAVTPDEIRLRMTTEVDHSRRDWKIERQPDEPTLPHVDWSITIADVYQYKGDSDSYCAWVEKWARTTLAEMNSS